MKKYLIVFSACLFLSSCMSGYPYLEMEKSEMRELLVFRERNLNEYEQAVFKRDSCASFTEVDNTFIFTLSDVSETQYTYFFENDTCTALQIKINCMACVNYEHRKWLFRGNWRVGNDGFLYKGSKPYRASIKRIENEFPFLWELHIQKLDKPIPREVYKKMEKVDKKWIGTRKYVINKDY